MGSTPSLVRVVGPLAPFAAGFAAELAGLGYTPLSAANQLRVLAHASRWLRAQGLEAGESRRSGRGCSLRPAGLRAIRAGCRSEDSRRCWVTCAGLAWFPGPRALGRARRLMSCSSVTGATWCRSGGWPPARSAITCAEARLFVTGAGPDLGGLTAVEVTGFVRQQCCQRSIGKAKILVTALRSLLRFLHRGQRVQDGLDRGAAPRGQVAFQPARPVERGGEPDSPVGGEGLSSCLCKLSGWC